MTSDHLDEITAAVIDVLEDIAPPFGAEAPASFYDELTENPGPFPSFVVVPRQRRRTMSTNSQREFVATIEIYLFFGANEWRYASASQRLWEAPVLDAFDSASRLRSTGVTLASINEVRYDPVELNDVPHVAITFSLEVTLRETFTFGA